MNNTGFSISLIDCQVEADSKVEFYKTKKSNIWIINPLDLQFDLIFLQNIDNINRHSWEIPGSWSALIQDKVTNNFKAISSIDNELPWYYSPDLPGYLSTSLHRLSLETKLKGPDPVSICSYVTLDWSIAGYSFIKGIRKSFGGSILKTNGKFIEEDSADLRKWLGFDDSIKEPQILVNTIVEICKEVLDCLDPRITLTAGLDSRAILAAGLLSGLPFTATTGISPSGDPIDLRVAKIISRKLGIKHIVVNASDNPAPPAETIYNEFALNFDSEYNFLNAIILYKEFISRRKAMTRVVGYGGEMFRRFYYVDVRKRLGFNLVGFNNEMAEEVKRRINMRYEEMRNYSEIDVRDLFYLRERHQWWGSSNIRPHLPYIKIRSPFSDPRIMALGFRFKGGINECPIHSALISTLPKEIQNIPVNGGKFYLLSVKIKKRLFPRINYSLLASPSHLSKVLDPHLFSNVIKEEKIRRMIGLYARHKGGYAGTLHKLLSVQYFFNNISY